MAISPKLFRRFTRLLRLFAVMVATTDALLRLADRMI